MAVAAFSFEAPAFSSLLAEPLPWSLDLSPPLVASFLLGAMARLIAERCSEWVASQRWVKSGSKCTRLQDFALSHYSLSPKNAQPWKMHS